VEQIPRGERNARIGQTRDDIAQFFDRMTPARLRDYLGPSRYELYTTGRVDDLRDFVNQTTLEPLRLDQLPEL